MKKLLLSFVSLVMTAGAWGQQNSVPFPVSTEGNLKPTFIHSYDKQGASGNYGNFKWYDDGNSNGYIKVTYGKKATPADVNSFLWYIIQINEKNGEVKYKIQNANTGKYIYFSGNSAVHDRGTMVKMNDTQFTKFTFKDGGFSTGVTGKIKDNPTETGELFLSLNSSRSDANGVGNKTQYLGTYKKHNGTNVTFPTENAVEVTFAAEYATVYLPFAAEIPASNTNIKAHAITSKTADKAVMGEEQTTIPANTGAVLSGGSNNTKVMMNMVSANAAANQADAWSNNQLKGSCKTTCVEGPAYVLALHNGQCGMYKAKLNKNAQGQQGQTHFQNNAGKAYLPAGGSTAKFLVFDPGQTVGIEELEDNNAEIANAPIYDLSGRRVSGTQKGIYIINGRKVIR